MGAEGQRGIGSVALGKVRSEIPEFAIYSICLVDESNLWGG